MQMRKNLARQFLYLFVPAAAVFGLAVVYSYSAEIKKEEAAHEASETMHLNLGKQVLEKDINTAFADLRVLSRHTELDTAGMQLSRGLREQLAYDFTAFAENKRNYDQVRLLDEAGKEVVRISFGSEQFQTVPEDQLQNKSRRSYFKETMLLDSGEIYISPLELNIEHGKVERPLKPVIRVSTPVFYSQEKKRGIVVLNYLGSSLIRDFKKAMDGVVGHAMLLDANGFWMYSPRPELEWGSQLGHGSTFKKQFPEAWKQIANMDVGHFYNSAGVFTFTTVYPQKLKTGGRVDTEPARSDGKTEGRYWKVVAHISAQDINAATTATAMKLLLVSAPLFLLLVAGVWWLAKARVQRFATEEALKKRAHQQAAVAELGQHALSGVRLNALMDTMVEHVAQVLEVEYCKVLKLLDDGEAFLLCAGVGWRQGLVGKATVGVGTDSQAGYTLASKEPVIVNNLLQETRFTGPRLLHDHNVLSGVSVVIHGVNRPFGVLGIHTSKQRVFTNDDVHFLQAAANILSEVIERESAQAQSRLQVSALEAAADGIVITDREGNIQWANPAYTRLTGYELDEVLGKNPRLLKSGEQDQAFYKKLWDTILSGKAWHGDLYNKRKDGSLYLEGESITPVLDQDGEISHFVAVKRDITERRQLQKQLQQAQKMEAIGQLTGGIAHDFNNMLSAVLGYTELAIEELSQDDNKELVEYLGEVHKAGSRARDLVAQMLAFSQGGEGKLEAYVLSLLITESLKMLGTTLPSSIEMDLHLDNGEITIMTNPVQIHQLVMNLCINARDAMEGKGHISIGLDRVNDVEIDCCSCHEKIVGDYIRLFVRDTGPGIQPEQLDRIFDPFYSTKEVGKGTGMGLSMVHGIMHDHGGHVVVTTEKDGGATFALLFPVIDAQVDTAAIEDTDTKASSNQTFDGNILIVDDEASVGHFIGELLKGCGCQVTVETDSRSALSKFERSPEVFDLVVTDQIMPGMTGAELAQSLLAIRPDLPIILCTGYSDQIDEAGAKALGIRGYLGKPIKTERFLNLVKELLQTNKPESEIEAAIN